MEFSIKDLDKTIEVATRLVSFHELCEGMECTYTPSKEDIEEYQNILFWLKELKELSELLKKSFSYKTFNPYGKFCNFFYQFTISESTKVDKYLSDCFRINIKEVK